MRNKTTALIVRPRSFRRRHLMVALAAFALTIAAVYILSRYIFPHTNTVQGSKAVAVVEVTSGANIENLPENSVFQAPLVFTEIQSRLKAPEFLRQILRDCGVETSPTVDNALHKGSFVSVEHLWQGLRVRCQPGVAPGEYRISLDLTLIQSPDAQRILRTLVDEFVREYRTYWAAEARKAYLDASAQTLQAQEAHCLAVEILQAFLDDLSRQEPVGQNSEPTQTPASQQATIQIFDNPVWVELDRKLIAFKNREAELLVSVTPLHPEIEYIRDNIADIEQQLSVTPRWAVEFPGENPPQPMVSSAATETLFPAKRKNPVREDVDGFNINTQLAEKIKQSQAAVEQTALDYQDKLEHEKKTYEVIRLEPTFSVLVNPIALATAKKKDSRELIGVMLFSGFAMALGAGILSSGAAIQPVLATIADLEPVLSVPIIGVVPSRDRSSNPIARKRRQVIRQWTLILLGGLMVSGCMGGVYWFFVHFG